MWAVSKEAEHGSRNCTLVMSFRIPNKHDGDRRAVRLLTRYAGRLGCSRTTLGVRASPSHPVSTVRGREREHRCTTLQISRTRYSTTNWSARNQLPLLVWPVESWCPVNSTPPCPSFTIPVLRTRKSCAEFSTEVTYESVIVTGSGFPTQYARNSTVYTRVQQYGVGKVLTTLAHTSRVYGIHEMSHCQVEILPTSFTIGTGQSMHLAIAASSFTSLPPLLPHLESLRDHPLLSTLTVS